MDDKKKAFLFALPVLGVVGGLKLLAVLYTLITSFQDSRPNWLAFQGEWIGLREYVSFIKSDDFSRVIGNSFTLGISSILFTCVMALILIWCITNMPKRWMKLFALSILAIPMFLPVSTFSYILGWEFGGVGWINVIRETLYKLPVYFWYDSKYYTLIFAYGDMLRNAVIPVILGCLVCQAYGKFQSKKVLLILCGYALIRATILLSPDIDMILKTYFYSPVYAAADTFDTFAYRIYESGHSDWEREYSLSAVSWVMKTILQFVINIGVVWGLYQLSRRLPKTTMHLGSEKTGIVRPIIGSIGYLLIAVHFCLMLYYLFPFALQGNFGYFFIKYSALFIKMRHAMMIALIFALICGITAVLVNYPMYLKTKWYPILLLMILTINNNIVGEGILLKQLEQFTELHTVVKYMLEYTGLFLMSAIGLFYAMPQSEAMPGFTAHLKKAIKPMICIMTLSFIISFGWNLNIAIGVMLHLDDAPLYAHAKANAFTFTASIIPVILGICLIWLEKFFGLAGFAAFSRR